MRVDKEAIANEIKSRLDGVSYLILTDYTGLTVENFTELRGRLAAKAKAKATVVKNTLLKRTLKEVGLPEMNGSLSGPTAMIYGSQDISAAANVLKGFAKEFKKPKIKMGVLDRAILSVEQIEAIADLPSREVLMAQLLSLLNTPATTLVRLLNIPATQLVQVLRAKQEKTPA